MIGSGPSLVSSMRSVARVLPNVEWELDAEGKRTGRWRRRQFYANVGDKRVPSERKACEWRTGEAR